MSVVIWIDTTQFCARRGVIGNDKLHILARGRTTNVPCRRVQTATDHGVRLFIEWYELGIFDENLSANMSQFFLNRNKRLHYVNMVMMVTLFLASCSASKKASVRASKVERVIHSARAFIGTPYKYGGTTRAGMDCSGLLMNSFQAIQLSLPRTSEAQSKVGMEVEMKDLQPGDLVFFATGRKKRKITHVGLVTEVNGRDNVKFIHASSSLGVVETNIYADYYQKRFRVARRVIQ